MEEIVGQLTTDLPTRNLGIHEQKNDTFLIDGNTHIRDINRTLKWSLPSKGPKTLNGLILEHMEIIPQTGTSLMIDSYTIEILRSSNNAVQTAKVQDTRSIRNGHEPSKGSAET